MQLSLDCHPTVYLREDLLTSDGDSKGYQSSPFLV